MYTYKNIILYGLRSCLFNLIHLIIQPKLRLEVGSFDKRFIFFKKKKKILRRIKFFINILVHMYVVLTFGPPSKAPHHASIL